MDNLGLTIFRVRAVSRSVAEMPVWPGDSNPIILREHFPRKIKNTVETVLCRKLQDCPCLAIPSLMLMS